MLEKMDEYFDSHVDEYEAKQLKNPRLKQLYKLSVQQLPLDGEVNVLDFGVGTGIELVEYFKYNENAKITGVDVSKNMLDRLDEKLKDHDLELVLDNFFNFNAVLNRNRFHSAITMFSTRYYQKDEKIYIYKKIYDSLVNDGYLIVTDMFATNLGEEKDYIKNFKKEVKENRLDPHEIYAYEMPLTITNEISALKSAGFKYVLIIQQVGKYAILKAFK